MTVFQAAGQSVDITLTAAADLSSSQYCWVYLDSSGLAALPTSTGQLAIGILQNAPASGELARVRVAGISKMVATAAITVADEIQAFTTTGRGGTAATAGHYKVAQALEAAAGAAQVIQVFVRNNGIV